MTLPIGWTLLLLVVAAWNLLVLPQFLRRVMRDSRARDESGRATRFLTVHVVLVTISLTLALAVGVLGLLTLF
ncbi:SCO4848 family membrane protein [Aeromicrobium sp. CTD01-1L150]|uniref:SCO4848 family membrane protein n=1 Tax=Aeromicrobium sp. CTD01-1L150 TaxID=3341830 RepID=UPI0035C1BABF